MTLDRFRRSMALALAFVIVAGFVVPVSAAVAPASFTGRVIGADGVSAQAGVRVTLYDAARAYSSAPTAADGGFALEVAAPGAYHVAVETPAGAYLLERPVTLASGANTPLALRLAPDAALTQGAEPTTTARLRRGLPPFAKWVVVGVIAAAALFVVSEVSEDEDEQPASEF
jgi:hypothetical protein